MILWEENLSVSPKYNILKSCNLFINKICVMWETVYSLCDKIITGLGDWSELTTLTPTIAVMLVLNKTEKYFFTRSVWISIALPL